MRLINVECLKHCKIHGCAVLTNLNHADSVLSGSETCMYNQASIIRSVRSSIPAGGPIVYEDFSQLFPA